MNLNFGFRNLGYTALTALMLTHGIARADAVLDWNAIMVSTIGAQQPFAQARFAAIMQLAVFEAVNAITGDYRPYPGTNAAPGSASADAAAISAAHTVLRNYFPANAVALDAARVSSLATIAEGEAKKSGIAVGETAAAGVIAMRDNDGSAQPEFY